MKKQERNKILNDLSNMTGGQALRDWLEENIDELKDVRNIDKESYEADGRGREHAVALLQKLFNTINIRVEATKKSNYL